MLLRTVILVTVFVTTTVVSTPTPKIEKSTWNSLNKIVQDVEIKNIKSDSTGRANNLEDNVENFIKNNEFSFNLPIIGSSVNLGAKNLDNGEIDMKLNFESRSNEVQARKKSKLKKIFVPILVFILLKAMTLIPLALGVLGIKTWNAIQLSFVSFIAALGMAVYKLCSKVGGEQPPQIIHNAWDPHHQYAARSDVIPEAQQMAYSAYVPQQ